MLRIIGNISNRKYELLIDYLLARCDVFTFHLPNFNKEVVTEKNLELCPDHKIG